MRLSIDSETAHAELTIVIQMTRAAKGAVSNLLNIQTSNFDRVVDEQGDLAAGEKVGGTRFQRFLVSLVESGKVNEGRLGGRTIRVLVGDEDFGSILQAMRQNRKTSVKNVVSLLSASSGHGLDADLKNRLANHAGKLGNQLLARGGHPKARSFAGLHAYLADKFVPEQRAARQDMIDNVIAGKLTPAMEQLDETSARMALEALATEKDIYDVLDDMKKRTNRVKRTDVNRAGDVLKELKSAEAHQTDTLQIRSLKAQVSDLSEQIRQGDDSPSLASELETAETELARLEGEAKFSFDTIKEHYISILEAHYEVLKGNDDALTFPASAYKKAETETTPGRRAASTTPPRSIMKRATTERPPEADAAKRVRFGFAETRKMKAEEGPLWDITRREDTLSLDEIETILSLSQLDHERLPTRLDKRLVKKLYGDLVATRERNGTDEQVQARTGRLLDDPIFVSRKRPPDTDTATEIHHIEDMIKDLNADSPADSRMILTVFQRLEKISGSRYQTAQHKKKASELLQSPLFSDMDKVEKNRNKLGAERPARTSEYFMEAARSGLDKARTILETSVLGDQHSTEEVLRLLESGDRGLRKATTVLGMISQDRWLKAENLSEGGKAVLQGTPEEWNAQADRLATIARAIEQAGFNEDVPGAFNQYGNTSGGSGNPFRRVAEQYPETDHQVRQWLAAGVNLSSELLSAFERGPVGGALLTDDEMKSLEDRVTAFSDKTARTTKFWSGPSEMDFPQDPDDYMKAPDQAT